MIKVHVGCGRRNFGPDWFHVDGGDYPHLNSHDIFSFGDNLPNEPISLIYAAHLIEYFDRVEVMPLLKGWYNLLAPGGILRLAVPDFDQLVMSQLYGKFKLKDILGPLYGKMKMGEEIIYHKTVYDFPDLKAALIETGFSKVKKYDWTKTDHAQFDDHSQAYLPKMDKANGLLISLNVEAVK